MSTIQVGEIDSSSPVDDLAARLSPPIDLPEGLWTTQRWSFAFFSAPQFFAVFMRVYASEKKAIKKKKA